LAASAATIPQAPGADDQRLDRAVEAPGGGGATPAISPPVVALAGGQHLGGAETLVQPVEIEHAVGEGPVRAVGARLA
jgi:hypothetical protein